MLAIIFISKELAGLIIMLNLMSKPTPLLSIQKTGPQQHEAKIVQLQSLHTSSLSKTPQSTLKLWRMQVEHYADERLVTSLSALKKEIRIRQILALTHHQLGKMNSWQLKNLSEQIESMEEKRLEDLLRIVKAGFERRLIIQKREKNGQLFGIVLSFFSKSSSEKQNQGIISQGGNNKLLSEKPQDALAENGYNLLSKSIKND